LNREAWAVPATTDQVVDVVSQLVAILEPGTGRDNPHRTLMMAQLIAQRGYSAAEVELIRREAPFRNHYGALIRLDVVDSVVKEHRELRAKLERPLTDREVGPVIDALHREGSTHITPDHFPCCGYNERDERLYRYRAEPLSAKPFAEISDERAQGVHRNDDAPVVPFVRGAR
jgi:hypothetical protein